MGAADVVPGVSGGTVALITGIYERLISALVAADKEALILLLRGRWRTLWYRLDGPFLALLLAGILTAVFSLASGVHWLLEYYPQPLWSFFSGLILVSGIVLVQEETNMTQRDQVLLFSLGVALAVGIAITPPASFLTGLSGLFFAGAIAICAMILPGISGSFILLLLGMYTPVLAAVRELQFTELAVFALGCALGLLTFTRLLGWLLRYARLRLMACLSGILLGSLLTVWPWQASVGFVAGDDLNQWTRAVLPTHPLIVEPQWALCGSSFALGVIVVWTLRRLSRHERR
jgi:putative membrane protein